MNHLWQQPITPLEIAVTGVDKWIRVLFIRPSGERGWQVISTTGCLWTSENALIRPARLDD